MKPADVVLLSAESLQEMIERGELTMEDLTENDVERMDKEFVLRQVMKTGK